MAYSNVMMETTNFTAVSGICCLHRSALWKHAYIYCERFRPGAGKLFLIAGSTVRLWNLGGPHF